MNLTSNLTVQAILAQRGKTGVPHADYMLVDDSDGTGPRIAMWTAATLGPQPTQADLDAVTPAQEQAVQTTQRTAQFTATSRQKDVLATSAQIVRARGIAAWNAMTLQQKKDAALAEADVWVTIRNFIEDNL